MHLFNALIINYIFIHLLTTSLTHFLAYLLTPLDSFMKTFRPITWDSPKVLLPLVNAPMLEYTIEFLAQNGVEGK